MFSRKDGSAPQLNRCLLHQLLPLPYILLGTDLQAPPSHTIRQTRVKHEVKGNLSGYVTYDRCMVI